MDQQTFLTFIQIGANVSPPVIGVAPSSLTATADADSIVLEWTNNDTYTSTVIERKTTGEFEALATAAGDAVTYNDTTATPGTTYTYKVRGVKGGYPTPFSNTASDTVPVASAASAAFTGTSGQDLIAADNTALNRAQTGTIIVGAWVKFAAQGSYMLAGKFGTADIRNWILLTDPDIAYFNVYVGGNVFATSSVTLLNDTKYFILGWFDPAIKTAYIQINNGDVDSDSTAHSLDDVASAGNFEIGGNTSFASDVFNGLIDEVFVCKDPADLTAALAAINTTIYNSGTGRRYDALDASTKTTIGLTSWWGLDEASGTRVDLHGDSDLTPAGTVAQGAALVS